MTVALQCVGVSQQYGRGAQAVHALREVSITIACGERVALVGSNGCGKSTLLRVLHGLCQPTQGDASHQPGLRQAMLFQRPNLLRLSVQTNLALGPWLAGVPWQEAKRRSLEALGRVGLVALAARNARTLSGGEQQRVAMARAWAMAPHVLFLDEPTASLDPQAKRDIEALMHTFAHQDPQMTLVFASHNLGQVKRLASRVIYLEAGRVQADLPVQDFFSGPKLANEYPLAHQFVRGETP